MCNKVDVWKACAVRYGKTAAGYALLRGQGPAHCRLLWPMQSDSAAILTSDGTRWEKPYRSLLNLPEARAERDMVIRYRG